MEYPHVWAVTIETIVYKNERSDLNRQSFIIEPEQMSKLLL